MNHDQNPHLRPRRPDSRGRTRLAIASVCLVALAGCGDDAKSATTTAAPANTTADTKAAVDLTAYCAVANELNNSESFPPTGDLLSRYVAAAPADLADEAAAVQPLIAATSSVVSFFVVFAQDDIEQAVATLNEYESEHCGIEHDAPGVDGSSMELESDAQRIDVVATDYQFAVQAKAAAGRTSFVLSNNGKEAHFLSINKLKEGVTLEEAMAAEDPSTVTEGSWDSNLAAPGGDDEEVITIDLEPGTYALFCFIPGAEGNPHAFMGMQAQIVVA